MNTGSMYCLKSKMSIQPRYDASFLAMNDELTITIMQKNKNELYEFLKRGFEARWNEAKAIILTRLRGQLFRGRGQVFWPRGRGLNEDLTSLTLRCDGQGEDGFWGWMSLSGVGSSPVGSAGGSTPRNWCIFHKQTLIFMRPRNAETY